MRFLRLLPFVGLVVLTGCNSGTYYRLKFEGNFPAPIPPSEIILDALRNDPELTKVTYRNSTDARAPIDRLLDTKYPETFMVLGTSSGFDINFQVDHGTAKVEMEESVYSLTPGYDDRGLPDLMTRVYGRLRNKISRLPETQNLKFSVISYKSTH